MIRHPWRFTVIILIPWVVLIVLWTSRGPRSTDVSTPLVVHVTLTDRPTEWIRLCVDTRDEEGGLIGHRTIIEMDPDDEDAWLAKAQWLADVRRETVTVRQYDRTICILHPTQE